MASWPNRGDKIWYDDALLDGEAVVAMTEDGILFLELADENELKED